MTISRFISMFRNWFSMIWSSARKRHALLEEWMALVGTTGRARATLNNFATIGGRTSIGGSRKTISINSNNCALKWMVSDFSPYRATSAMSRSTETKKSPLPDGHASVCLDFSANPLDHADAIRVTCERFTQQQMEK
jgi:hypothetical protein